MTLNLAPPPEPTPTINVLLLGAPKTGKTAGACSAPGKVLHLNADLGEATRYARLTHGDRIDEVRLSEQKGLIKLLHQVVAEANKDTYGTIVIDPVGELHRLLLEEESGGSVRPTLNQYGDTTSNVERFCRAMCKAPVNFIIVAHDHPVKDDEATMQLPWTGTTNPSLGRKLLGMVDIIGFTGVRIQQGSREYVAQLVEKGGRPGGDRFNCLAGAQGHRKLDLAEWVQTIQEAERGTPTK